MKALEFVVGSALTIAGTVGSIELAENFRNSQKVKRLKKAKEEYPGRSSTDYEILQEDIQLEGKEKKKIYLDWEKSICPMILNGAAITVGSLMIRDSIK